MKLQDKLEPAKTAIVFISRHDDAPVAERRKLLDALKAFIDAELSEAAKREAAKPKE